MDATKGTSNKKKALSAVCGLFCPACIVFIAQRESGENRQKIAESLKIPVEMLKCDGCRAENRFLYCENSCKIAPCAEGKRLDFCGECADYPCEIFKSFQAEMPHRLELYEAQGRIKEVGYEKWFDEMLEHYACPECNAINSAYHPVCRECGTTPSCGYRKKHKDEIERHSFDQKP